MTPFVIDRSVVPDAAVCFNVSKVRHSQNSVTADAAVHGLERAGPSNSSSCHSEGDIDVFVTPQESTRWWQGVRPRPQWTASDPGPASRGPHGADAQLIPQGVDHVIPHPGPVSMV